MKRYTGDSAHILAWNEGVDFEEELIASTKHLAALPFIHKHVALMPDAHIGLGSNVGTVMATKGAVIPAAVGVDIGCGMMAVKTSLTAGDMPDSLAALRHSIERGVPVGFDPKRGTDSWMPDKIPPLALSAYNSLGDFRVFFERHPKIEKYFEAKSVKQMGTLGSGNHFIEICLDENDSVWVMLHSGSRGIGNKIGRYFIELAKKEMERWFIRLPNKDLAYIPEGSDYFQDYINAMNWAQSYASANREVMMHIVLRAIRHEVKEFSTDEKAINCHHNYTRQENHFGEEVWLTRKGAVCARKEVLGIIPGSMGGKSYIVEGLGNRESYNSCSHGAGRRFSRKEAKRRFTLDDHKKAVQGVECRIDEDVIDETPAAYKDLDAVMHAQKDLVKIKHTLKQILCVKG